MFIPKFKSAGKWNVSQMRNSWNHFFSPESSRLPIPVLFWFWFWFLLHPAIYCFLDLEPSVIFLLCQNFVLNLGVFISSTTKDVVARIKFYCCSCSVIQSCLALCDPMNCSTPGFSVLHHLLEFSQTHVHCVDDAIQLSHQLSPPSNCNQNLMPWTYCEVSL